VSKSLHLPLWEHQFIYDAGHFMMVPMHYAFRTKDTVKILEFDVHFARFLGSYKDEAAANDKARMHYFYLISQYISLRTAYQPGVTTQNLTIFLETQVKEYWLSRDAWHWSKTKFKGMKQRLDKKLEQGFASNDPLYYGFIFDDEKFLFAIAADLVYQNAAQRKKSGPVLREILDYAELTYRKKIQFFKDGSWLMQAGVLSDHPDYAYSGYEAPKVHAKPKKNLLQAEDSSHSMRYPLWIRSLKKANMDNHIAYAFYDSLEIGLVKTMELKVLKAPTRRVPYYHLTNYMDGQNGLYAWKNGSINEGGFNGFEPNGLSFSMCLGWWAFLESEKIQSAYHAINQNWSKAFIGKSNVDNTFITKELIVLIVRIAATKYN
jgi:hypothetical protein